MFVANWIVRESTVQNHPLPSTRHPTAHMVTVSQQEAPSYFSRSNPTARLRSVATTSQASTCTRPAAVSPHIPLTSASRVGPTRLNTLSLSASVTKTLPERFVAFSGIVAYRFASTIVRRLRHQRQRPDTVRNLCVFANGSISPQRQDVQCARLGVPAGGDGEFSDIVAIKITDRTYCTSKSLPEKPFLQVECESTLAFGD